MHEADGFRERAIKLRYAAGHRAGMPVLEHAASGEPVGIIIVGRFRRRFVRQCEDARLAVRIAVELDARALFHVRVRTLPEAPARFLAVDDRPAQAARLVIVLERREVVAMATAEQGIFLEQSL